MVCKGTKIFPIRQTFSFVILFFWFLTKAVTDRQQGIAAHRVGPALGATLRTDVVVQAGNLPEKVVATQFHDPFPLFKRFRERRIPVEAVVVHFAVGVAAARVHRQVGVEREVPRQFVGSVQAVGDVPNVGGLFAEGDVAMDVAIGEIAVHVECEFVFREGEAWFIADVRGAHAAEFAVGAACGEGEAGAFRVSERQFVADEPSFLLVKGTAPIDRGIDVPVAAADVLGAIGSHARCRVVGVAIT